MLAAKRPPDGRVLATNGSRIATNPRQSSLYLLIIFILLRLSEICRWGRAQRPTPKDAYCNLCEFVKSDWRDGREAERGPTARIAARRECETGEGDRGVRGFFPRGAAAPHAGGCALQGFRLLDLPLTQERSGRDDARGIVSARLPCVMGLSPLHCGNAVHARAPSRIGGMLRGKPSAQAIEPDAGVAHIGDMSGSTARTPPSKKHASGAALKYRGVALQTP